MSYENDPNKGDDTPGFNNEEDCEPIDFYYSVDYGTPSQTMFPNEFWRQEKR